MTITEAISLYQAAKNPHAILHDHERVSIWNGHQLSIWREADFIRTAETADQLVKRERMPVYRAWLSAIATEAIYGVST